MNQNQFLPDYKTMRTPPRAPSPNTTIINAVQSKKRRFEESQQTENYSWQTLFNRNIAIGESHHHISPKRFLIDNMELIASQGYKMLFLEHIGHDDFFDDLEEFNETGNLSNKLKRKLRRLDEGHITENPYASQQQKELGEKYNFTEIVLAAQKFGIKIFALEASEESWKLSRITSSEKRMQSFNHNAIETIKEKELKFSHQTSEKLKWICLVGSGHVRKHSGVFGICDTLDAQDVVIYDTADPNEQTLRENILDENSHTKDVTERFSLFLRWDYTQPMHLTQNILPFFDKQKSGEISDNFSNIHAQQSDLDEDKYYFEKNFNSEGEESVTSSKYSIPESKPAENIFKKRRYQKDEKSEITIQKLSNINTNSNEGNTR